MKIQFPRSYLILRGGLGNQLNQIAALSKFVEMNGGEGRIFSHIVDHAIDETRRGFWREIFDQGMFSNPKIREVNQVEEFLIRVIWKFPLILQNKIINQANFFDPHHQQIALIHDYFDEKKYCTDNLELAVISKRKIAKNDLRIIKMHVRLTDYVGIDEFQPTVEYYSKALDRIRYQGGEIVECLTDDIKAAQIMLDSLIRNKTLAINFPELQVKFTPIQVLKTLANADVLICSRSSLCWWAAISVIKNGGTIISPWGSEKNLESFIQIKE